MVYICCTNRPIYGLCAACDGKGRIHFPRVLIKREGHRGSIVFILRGLNLTCRRLSSCPFVVTRGSQCARPIGNAGRAYINRAGWCPNSAYGSGGLYPAAPSVRCSQFLGRVRPTRIRGPGVLREAAFPTRRFLLSTLVTRSGVAPNCVALYVHPIHPLSPPWSAHILWEVCTCVIGIDVRLACAFRFLMHERRHVIGR